MAVKRNLTDEKGKKVKISQAEIDAVKKMGMKKALAAAGKNPVIGASRSNAEQFKQAKLVEAVRRLYGESRFQNAVYKPKASPGPVGSPRSVERSATKSKPSPKVAERATKPKAKSNALTPRQVAQQELSASRAAKFNDPVNKRFPNRKF
jgi:hypothetical protein